MEQEFISKKEILEQTGISYGQLYRWKRKNIIPEDWFIKKSSFTGQETFFPREKILERISKILELKDQYSLDELADFFSPNPADISLSSEDIIRHGLIKKETWELHASGMPEEGELDFKSVLILKLVEEISFSEKLTSEASGGLFTFLNQNSEAIAEEPFRVLGTKQEGLYRWFLISGESRLIAETEIVADVNATDIINELNIQITEMKK